MTRRTLNFQSLQDVRADVARLAAAPYRRCGTWHLATMCDHLARTMEAGIHQTPIPMPLPLRVLSPLIGGLVFKRILKKRQMPTGIKAPAPFTPAENCDCTAAVARLNAAIDRANAITGQMPRHPFFGPMTADQWRDLMVIHAMHHLSFLAPDGESDGV